MNQNQECKCQTKVDSNLRGKGRMMRKLFIVLFGIALYFVPAWIMLSYYHIENIVIGWLGGGWIFVGFIMAFLYYDD